MDVIASLEVQSTVNRFISDSVKLPPKHPEFFVFPPVVTSAFPFSKIDEDLFCNPCRDSQERIMHSTVSLNHDTGGTDDFSASSETALNLEEIGFASCSIRSEVWKTEVKDASTSFATIN